MKGEVLTEMGVTTSGKFWLAAFVVDLDSHKDAAELQPELERVVAEFVRDRVRHGMHIVASSDNAAQGNSIQD